MQEASGSPLSQFHIRRSRNGGTIGVGGNPQDPGPTTIEGTYW